MDPNSQISQAFSDILPEVRVSEPPRDRFDKVLVKSVIYSEQENSLYCRCYDFGSGATYTVRVEELVCFAGFVETDPDSVKRLARLLQWFRDSVLRTVTMTVFIDELRRHSPVTVIAFNNPAQAIRFLSKARENGFHFGEFKLWYERYRYVSWDGNTPALVNNLMFGRVYFLPKTANRKEKYWIPSEFIYCQKAQDSFNIEAPEIVKRAWVTCALDIETVFDRRFRDAGLMCKAFEETQFPYVTEHKIADQTAKLAVLNSVLKRIGCNRTIKPKQRDTSGLLHEITSVSIVLTNQHEPKTPERRKKLIVIYNKLKTTHDYEIDPSVCADVGVDPTDVGGSGKRIQIVPAKSELDLLLKMMGVLLKSKAEIVYVYNANFDIRVIEQRVMFYAFVGKGGCCATHTPVNKARFTLKHYWDMFMLRHNMSTPQAPKIEYTLLFDTIKLLEMYDKVIASLKNVLRNHFTYADQKNMETKPTVAHSNRYVMEIDEEDENDDEDMDQQTTAADPTVATPGADVFAVAVQECKDIICQFNKQKKKVGHFKVKGFGTAIIDLYCMCYTRDKKYKYANLKLDTVVAGEVSSHRRERNLPPKTDKKLHKIQDVPYDQLDSMLHSGKTDLFKVLIYNLVDSMLCVRLAKTMTCLRDLVYKCLASYNIDCLSHGRLENFQGFVQSIHSVSLPALKVRQDRLMASASALAPVKDFNGPSWTWKGGVVADPLKGLHYATGELGLEICLDYKSMYPSLMGDLNVSPETIEVLSAVQPTAAGWLGYHWRWEGSNPFDNVPKSENFPCLTLIGKLSNGTIERYKAMLPACCDLFLGHRQKYKRLNATAETELSKAYYAEQEQQMKLQANSYYGTADWPCGPLIAGHGRRLIGFVNKIMNVKRQGMCVQIYGDTDSTMFVSETTDEYRGTSFDDAVAFIVRKFKLADEQIKTFLKDIRVEMIEDCLKRMVYVLPDKSLVPAKVLDTSDKDKDGVAVYTVETEVGRLRINETFAKDYRTELEYETAASVFCHVSKKTYVALVHELNGEGDVIKTSAKTKGLPAYKSNKNAGTLLVTNFFVNVVIKGHAVVVDKNDAVVFLSKPWPELKPNDMVLLLDADLTTVTSVEIRDVETSRVRDFEGVTVTFKHGDVTPIRVLYKHNVSFSHMYDRTDCLRRNAVYRHVATLLTLKYAAGIFNWRHLPKVESQELFHRDTLERFMARGVYDGVALKVPYVTIVKTNLPKVFKNKEMSIYTKVPGFHRQDPAVALLGRFPIETHAKIMCNALVGGSLLCGSKLFNTDALAKECKKNWPVVTDQADHSLRRFHIKYVVSLYEMADRYDRIMVNNTKGKFLTHVVINDVLPQTAFLPKGTDLEELSSKIMSRLRETVNAVNAACDDGKACLMSVMRTCPPEIMLPPMEQRYDVKTDLGAFALPKDERLHIRRVLQVTGFDVKNICYVPTIRSLLDALVAEKIVCLRPIAETRVIGYIPAPLADALSIDPNTRGIQLRGSTSSTDQRLMELAQYLYFQTLLCHVTSPRSFPTTPSPLSMLQDNALMCTRQLCVPPKVCTEAVLEKWMVSAATYLTQRKDKALKYHCTYCRVFFKTITTHKKQFNVRCIAKVYKTTTDGQQRRQLGTCTFET